MAKTNKVWITTAITGAIHTPGMSPYLPLTPQEIIDSAVGAAEAGSAVVHIHSRDPKNGSPTRDVNVMKEIVSGIKKRSGVVVCITSGGAMYMPLEDRLKPISLLQPELATLNAGSMNCCLTPALEVVKKSGAKYDWEIPFLESTWDCVFPNTFYTLENFANTMNECGTRPEFEIYDVGMVNNVAFLIRKGLIKTPPYIQFVLGLLGGAPATVENLTHLLRAARDLIGDFHWSVAAAGRHQFPICAAALALGGNVRVGLEDNLFLRPGVHAKSNAEQVFQMKEVIERLGFGICGPDEVRQIMGLKGAQNVAF